jgi:hypothetical protein
MFVGIAVPGSQSTTPARTRRSFLTRRKNGESLRATEFFGSMVDRVNIDRRIPPMKLPPEELPWPSVVLRYSSVLKMLNHLAFRRLM